MTFKPGKSGNPNGRPKVAMEFRDRCRTYMSIDGWKRLHAILSNPKHDEHGQMLRWTAEMAYGKASQTMELGGDVTLRINLG